MVTNGSDKVEGVKGSSEEPRSIATFNVGITTAHQFCTGMSLLMGDVLSRRVPPNVANAVCNAGGKLLKAVELQRKYGTKSQDGSTVLVLAGD